MKWVYAFFISLLLVMNLLMADQNYESINLSESATNSENGVLTVDPQDHFHLFWIEEKNEIRYRNSSNGTTWAEILSVYQSHSTNGIDFITTEYWRDTAFVFFTEEVGDSVQLVRCAVADDVVQYSDTLHTFDTVENLKSVSKNDEMIVAVDTYPYGYGSVFFITFPGALEDTLIHYDYYCSYDFAVAYDPGDTLWFFSGNEDMLWTRYRLTVLDDWSSWIPAFDGEQEKLPTEQLDCKYNPASGNFNILFCTPKASCTDCIENRVIYSEGYGASWSDYEDVASDGGSFMLQGRYDDPFLELTSNGVRKAVYKKDFSDEIGGDEYTIRLNSKENSTAQWTSEKILSFSSANFNITSTAMDSNDSLYIVYVRNNDVYFAKNTTTSALGIDHHVLKNYQLFPVYPNPLGSQNTTTSATIKYQLPFVSQVELTVYNVLGKKIQTLFQGKQQAGLHTVKWTPSALPPGIYFYRVKVNGQFRDVKKMIMLQ